MADPLQQLLAMAGKQLAAPANPTNPFDSLIQSLQSGEAQQQDAVAQVIQGFDPNALYDMFQNPLPKPNFMAGAGIGSGFSPMPALSPRAAGPVGPGSASVQPSASPSSASAPATPNIPAANPNVKAPLGHLNWISPIKGMPLSSLNLSQGADFGPRVHPVHGGYSNHTGIDFSAPGGTIIRAPANARVYAVNSGDSVYGNQVILRHGKGYQTMYGHMSSTAVKPGQKVKRGQPIGAVGSTGLSTGNHLHFETWYKRKPMDPMMIMG